MVCFLTSSTRTEDDLALNPANGFVTALREAVGPSCRGLFICSDPEKHERTELYAASVWENLSQAGIRVLEASVLDGRNADRAPALVAASDLIVLGGGHVPTQNRFFQKIGLKALLQNWSGVVIGISAGTMNSADTVYAQPELEGEAVRADYERFLPGLGLTKVNILPHYQAIRDEVLDGLRLFEDITFSDSMGRCFYAIPDGSYLYVDGNTTELRGEAWRIRDGSMEKLSGPGGVVRL